MVADAWEKARLEAEALKKKKFAAKKGVGGGGGSFPDDKAPSPQEQSFQSQVSNRCILRSRSRS